MSHQTSATTTRDVEVTRIPSGERITLATGTEVLITQALGGSFTILVPSQAGLYRIEGQDADAIGREATSGSERPTEGDLEQAAWNQLKTCYDPEIPVNIVDLGLVYSLDIKSHQEGGSEVNVQMTLTAPGCGMGPILASEARQKILTLDGVTDANVDLVWDPPWTPDRISEAGKQKLGMV
ncbi:MAG TPA: putative Fe-S cluster assembly protein SufT [Terrimicrobiaceae bacterium]|nr:putative Fe-S cluster assembly protein SufT [Terrimicrobiaceae bacterium]